MGSCDQAGSMGPDHSCNRENKEWKSREKQNSLLSKKDQTEHVKVYSSCMLLKKVGTFIGNTQNLCRQDMYNISGYSEYCKISDICVNIPLQNTFIFCSIFFIAIVFE